MSKIPVHIPEARLLIFVRNLEQGKVKTRIARVLGNEQAFQIYKHLLTHTYQVAQQVPVRSAIYYSSHIPATDADAPVHFEKCLQEGADLGARMGQAFHDSFAQGYQKVVIIGSDCYDLRPAHLGQAFSALDSYDSVIGPAQDGGYYLLGLRQYWPFVFENKAWGRSSVLSQTLSELQEAGKRYAVLSTLSDIDDPQDLPSSWRSWL